MIYNNVLLHVKQENNIDTVRALLIEQARRSREEPGCVRFEVYQSNDDRQQFILVEQWQTEQHLADHREAPAFQELYLPKVVPLVERTPHLCELVG